MIVLEGFGPILPVFDPPQGPFLGQNPIGAQQKRPKNGQKSEIFEKKFIAYFDGFWWEMIVLEGFGPIWPVFDPPQGPFLGQNPIGGPTKTTKKWSKKWKFLKKFLLLILMVFDEKWLFWKVLGRFDPFLTPHKAPS